MDKAETRRQIKEIEQWLNHENIIDAHKDNDMILKFLSGCKYQTEKVKQKMKNFYEIRKTSPELFQGRDPLMKNLETLLDRGAFFPLPLESDEGHTLVLVKAGANDPKTIPLTDVFKLGIMSIDLLMKTNEGVTENGVWVIVDLKGVSIHHALQMTPTLVRKMVHLWQDCYPIRIQGIDFINAPKGADVVLNVIRRFLGENLKRKLRTHGSQIESLHSIVNKKLLPKEYGGRSGPESGMIQDWKWKVQNHRQWFLNDET